jgi:Na+-translocating ferredoxin:NAD+ oxidoreductase subunit B
MSPLISFWFSRLLIALSLLAVGHLVLKIIRYYMVQQATQKSLLTRINRILPQTQCGQCGHLGCLPYAKAISQGEAVNKCPPGGIETIRLLTTLLNEPQVALDPAHGSFRDFSVAFIREDECIGCTKCIQACPVDAILGGPKLMHTVIASECTGCDLCVEPCPVDCIDMIDPSNKTAGQFLPTYPIRQNVEVIQP